ncbi:MAG: type 4a pilus biogenesis protein PilO, partial [Staphylococcus warneri]|nr:type 4a pilus biogenesis protein PilO [Staphylococcus warneri]
QLKDDENKLDTRQQLNEELQNLARQANEKSKRLSYDMQDGMFLVGLSNMMSKNSIELLNYSIDPSVKYENFYAIPTTLQVRGNYRYIREIMYYLEEQQNVTQIQNFNMEAYKKPELSNTSTEQGTTQPIDVKKENKQNGDVTATFKFIMYMSQDPSLKLEIENPNNWNPGKFNPFVSSTN